MLPYPPGVSDDSVLRELGLPEAAVARVVADTAAASQLAARDAELLDLLTQSGLEPRLIPAAVTLTFLAAARPNRQNLGG